MENRRRPPPLHLPFLQLKLQQSELALQVALFPPQEGGALVGGAFVGAGTGLVGAGAVGAGAVGAGAVGAGAPPELLLMHPEGALAMISWKA